MEAYGNTLGPILTAHLFHPLEGKLIELLRSLPDADWELQTVSPKWKVKDVAAHLLDTQLRKLSMARDEYRPAPRVSIESASQLIAFVDKLNQEGVAVYRRLSPIVLMRLMELASKQNADFHLSLDPLAQASLAVSWAGEQTSLNWFDTAREFTERWHHQQQIRLAVNKPGIMTREFYYPVLDCFMRALPFSYRDVYAHEGSLLRFDIVGDCGGVWYLQRGEKWELVEGGREEVRSHVQIPQEVAWRLFTKGIDRGEASKQIQIEGDRELGTPVLSMISIIG